MIRRTPTLTKQVRDIAEAYFFEHRRWPWSWERCFGETGLSAGQIRDALFSENADEWRRGVLTKFKETL